MKTRSSPERRATAVGLRRAVHLPQPGQRFCVLRVQCRRRELVSWSVTPGRAPANRFRRAARGSTTARTACSSRRRISTGRPTSLEGIEKYLGSGLIKGIGPHYPSTRRRLRHGRLDVSSASPTGCATCRDWSVRAARIPRLAEQRTVREFMVFLTRTAWGRPAPSGSQDYGRTDRAGEREPYRLAA